MKAFLNLLILSLCVGLAVVAVVAYGENPLTTPIVRISATDNKCVSVMDVVGGIEVEKSCDFFEQMKKRGKPYEIQTIGPVSSHHGQ